MPPHERLQELEDVLRRIVDSNQGDRQCDICGGEVAFQDKPARFFTNHDRNCPIRRAEELLGISRVVA